MDEDYIILQPFKALRNTNAFVLETWSQYWIRHNIRHRMKNSQSFC